MCIRDSIYSDAYYDAVKAEKSPVTALAEERADKRYDKLYHCLLYTSTLLRCFQEKLLS